MRKTSEWISAETARANIREISKSTKSAKLRKMTRDRVLGDRCGIN
jgi:hypothetical protein